MVWLVDYAYDVPASFQEGKGMVGGFTMRTINTTRLCVTTINAECLKVKGPDVSTCQAPLGPWVAAVFIPFCVLVMLCYKGCSWLCAMRNSTWMCVQRRVRGLLCQTSVTAPQTC